MHATLRVGGKVSGASPAYNVEEMTYALKTADAKFLMTHPNSMEVAVKAAANAGIPRENLFLLEGEGEGCRTVKELIEMGRREGEQVDYFRIPEGKTNFDICELQEADLCLDLDSTNLVQGGFLSFSSGTTGLPKAVSISYTFVRIGGLI